MRVQHAARVFAHCVDCAVDHEAGGIDGKWRVADLLQSWSTVTSDEAVISSNISRRD
jgi:hypothetical protein